MILKIFSHLVLITSDTSYTYAIPRIIDPTYLLQVRFLRSKREIGCDSKSVSMLDSLSKQYYMLTKAGIIMAEAEDLTELIHAPGTYCLNESTVHNCKALLKKEDSAYLESDTDE